MYSCDKITIDNRSNSHYKILKNQIGIHQFTSIPPMGGKWLKI